jgi:hypothetical protein
MAAQAEGVTEVCRMAGVTGSTTTFRDREQPSRVSWPRSMTGHEAEFVLTGIDQEFSNHGVTNRRMVCHIASGDRMAIWGRKGHTEHIAAIEAHGFPCTISCWWREPHPWEREQYGSTHCLDESASMRIL